ncbi:hypothetical protein GALL_534600 [mine drainage metagenome]|uniref:Uncharacterized protein n=1 Tax=mine drainage metagenome TaxID=410659 RepID=A0A1J5P1P1_9ZZZZ
MTSILACWAIISDVGGTISPARGGAAAMAGALSEAAFSEVTLSDDILLEVAGMVTAGAAGAGECEASDIFGSTGDFSACWNATSMT